MNLSLSEFFYVWNKEGCLLPQMKMVGLWSAHDISLKSWRRAKGMWSHTEQGIQYNWIMHAAAARSTVPVPGQVTNTFFPCKHTHTHTESSICFCSRFDFSSPQQTHDNAHQHGRFNGLYLSHRRKWRFSPGWSPPSRCSDPCERDGPWECTALTSHLPFSPPALSDALLAATAWLSRPDTAARRAR